MVDRETLLDILHTLSEYVGELRSYRSLEAIPKLAPSARGRARACQARRAERRVLVEQYVEEARRSMAGSQPAEARMEFWDSLLPAEEVIGNRQVQSAVRYAFQTAIQCVLDAGLHILVDAGLGHPRDNRDIIRELGANGIIPADFAARIEGMAGFRNILVHRHFKVDSERVHRHLRDDLGDFDIFLEHVRKYLDRAAR